MGDPTYAKFLPILVVGIACTTVGSTTHGLVQGLLTGAGIALLLLSAYGMGSAWRGSESRGGTSWLPSRDERADAMTDSRLADAVAEAVLGDLVDVDRQDHLVLVRRCEDANLATRDLLLQAVNSARGAGHSWSAIGEVLGMSRQAAQQRFGGRRPPPRATSGGSAR